jgi:hypothetical protein
LEPFLLSRGSSLRDGEVQRALRSAFASEARPVRLVSRRSSFTRFDRVWPATPRDQRYTEVQREAVDGADAARLDRLGRMFVATDNGRQCCIHGASLLFLSAK